MRLLFVAVLLLGWSAVNAAQVVLDFNELSETVETFDPIGSSTQLANGFQISAIGSEGVWINFAQGAPPGTDQVAAGINPNGGSITLSRNDGAAFDLLSFVFTADNAEQYPNGSFSISGVQVGGIINDPQVFGSYELAGYNWDTYLAGGNFDEITSLTIAYSGLSAGGFYFDNVVVNAVPIPAAVWLFGSALAGLGWIRRKSNV
jgi:hypothetical protein